jgi:hypothetical protein
MQDFPARFLNRGSILAPGPGANQTTEDLVSIALVEPVGEFSAPFDGDAVTECKSDSGLSGHEGNAGATADCEGVG